MLTGLLAMGWIWDSLYTCWNKTAFTHWLDLMCSLAVKWKICRSPVLGGGTRLSFCLSLKVGNSLPFLCIHLPKVSHQTLTKRSVIFLGAISVRFKALCGINKKTWKAIHFNCHSKPRLHHPLWAVWANLGNTLRIIFHEIRGLGPQ